MSNFGRCSDGIPTVRTELLASFTLPLSNLWENLAGNHFATTATMSQVKSLVTLTKLSYLHNIKPGSINLLEVMSEFRVTRIVFSSSATVYGQPVYLPIDEEHPVGDCVNPYGKTKFFNEEIFKVIIIIHSTISRR